MTSHISQHRLAALDPALEALRERVLTAVTPSFCSGSLPLTPSKGGLFYSKGEGSEASLINFAGDVKDDDILGMVDVCQPATFGHGAKDVLDESYRKAWKLDTSQFATQFDIVQSGIMETVHDQLLHYEKNSMLLEPHLYKLNIYGPGSFFKPHVDTPRSEKLFATLVVVLPTVHTGGKLLLGKDGDLFTFESSKKVYHEKTKAPQITYAAFYSDIEHEVSLVETGYRISLTYNLYLSSTAMIIPKTLSTRTLGTIVTSIAALISNPRVLPKGGALGFGLLYRYPVDPIKTDLAQFTGALKGNDAVVRTACHSLGLTVTVKVRYQIGFGEWRRTDEYITNKAQEGDDELHQSDDDDSVESRYMAAGGWKVTDPLSSNHRRANLPVLWVTPPTRMVETSAAYLTYGNEASLAQAYGDLVLIAEVLPLKKRLPALLKQFPVLKKKLEGHLAGQGSDADESELEVKEDEKMSDW